jgi:hypothetical protein
MLFRPKRPQQQGVGRFGRKSMFGTYGKRPIVVCGEIELSPITAGSGWRLGGEDLVSPRPRFSRPDHEPDSPTDLSDSGGQDYPKVHTCAGRGGASLRPLPLRTVRATFTAHGSSKPRTTQQLHSLTGGASSIPPSLADGNIGVPTFGCCTTPTPLRTGESSDVAPTVPR